MAEKLIIVMANSDPRNGEELGAPIFQASVAAAMEYEVDVICTATSGILMKKGVAENLVVKEGSPKTVYDFIKDAHEAGVKFYCCSPNLDLRVPIAAEGRSEPADLDFSVGYATRTREDALNGYLPQRFPHVCYMRDHPVPPDYADILAVVRSGPLSVARGQQVLSATL